PAPQYLHSSLHDALPISARTKCRGHHRAGLAPQWCLPFAAALAVLLSAWGASAKVYIEFRPRMSMMGGYDDNVRLNGSGADAFGDRKSTRLNSSHLGISY